MGIHRRGEGQGPEPEQKPIPLPAKAGRNIESCDGTSKLNLFFTLMPNSDSKFLQFGGENLDQKILNEITTGARISWYTYSDWCGEPVPPDMDPSVLEESSESNTKEVGDIEKDPNKERPVLDEDWTKTFGQPGKGTVPRDSEPELKKKEEYEVKKTKKKPQGMNLVYLEIEADNKKEKLLEKKINKRVGKGAGNNTDKVHEVVKKVGEDCGFDVVKVGHEEIYMPKMDINELFAREVLDICSKLAGAGYALYEDTLHFNRPGDKPHPRIATTDPNNKSASESLSRTSVRPNSIRKATAEVTDDATEITNKVQVKNAGEETPRKEIIPGGGFQDEFHMSYEPEPLTEELALELGVDKGLVFFITDTEDEVIIPPTIIKNAIPYGELRMPDYIYLEEAEALDAKQKAEEWIDESGTPSNEVHIERLSANIRKLPVSISQQTAQIGVLIEYCVKAAISAPTSATFSLSWQLTAENESFSSAEASPSRNGYTECVLPIPIGDAFEKHLHQLFYAGASGIGLDFDEFVADFERLYGTNEDLFRDTVYITSIKLVYDYTSSTPVTATWPGILG